MDPNDNDVLCKILVRICQIDYVEIITFLNYTKT